MKFPKTCFFGKDLSSWTATGLLDSHWTVPEFLDSYWIPTFCQIMHISGSYPAALQNVAWTLHDLIWFLDVLDRLTGAITKYPLIKLLRANIFFTSFLLAYCLSTLRTAAAAHKLRFRFSKFKNHWKYTNLTIKTSQYFLRVDKRIERNPRLSG